MFLQKLFSFFLQFTIFGFKFSIFCVKVLSKILNIFNQILQLVSWKTFLCAYSLDLNGRQAKISKCCLHFANSDAKICIWELPFCHVSEVFIAKLPEIINIGFDEWTQAMNRIREQDGIK